MDAVELRNMMYTAQLGKYGPFSIRYPRGRAQRVDWQQPFSELKPGKARKLKEGSDIAILSIGYAGNLVQEALKKLNTSPVISLAHYDMRYAKPLDEEILHSVFKQFDRIITVEDGTIVGGFGSAVIEFMCENSYQAHVKRLGVPDRFIDQGKQSELYKECGFDPDSIISAIRSVVRPGILFNVG